MLLFMKPTHEKDKFMNPFDFFDDIYCICISSRKEKKRKAEEQFKQLGISDRVEFFEAILSEPYWDGCRESHKECIRRAKEKGARNVLIFEEDVLFLHKDHKALEKCLDDLSKTDWDLFLLCGVVKEVKSHVTENLCLVNAYHTHAHALNRKFFDTVLSFEGDNKRYYDDGKRVWSRGSIDIFLAQKTLKYMIKPIMAVQPDKGSNTLQRYYDNVL